MKEFFTLPEIDEIALSIQKRLPRQPRIGIILGTGFGPVADMVQDPVNIPYEEINNWPLSTVLGHSGRLVAGQVEGQSVVIMKGRVHYYEGYNMAQVTLPIRVMQRMGIEILIVTNAAGAVNPDYEPGDLMLLTDHLNMIGMAGPNPLRGPNLDELGPRFPDMSRVYDREISEIARKVAAEEKIVLHEGVYVCLAGPSFETPADLRFLRAIGVDAVGMSTVPEVTVARHAGQRVLGVSGISNKANLDGDTITTHEEVLEAGEVMVPKLISLIKGVLIQL
jgi:purine-nucleoside phosphorylase